MNERIRELALQAGLHLHKGGTLDAGPNGIAKFVLYSDMEKFAELIVRECAGVCDDERDSTDSNFGKLVADGCALKIMEHFGVEE